MFLNPIRNYDSNMEQEVLTRFIEAYKKSECLWDIASVDYCNRSKRNTAYEQLCEILKELYNTANIDSTKKKIEIMRNSYRREMKRVTDSAKRKGSDHIPYRPSLWYYSLMDSFLSKNKPATDCDSIEDDATSEKDEMHPSKKRSRPQSPTATTFTQRKLVEIPRMTTNQVSQSPKRKENRRLLQVYVTKGPHRKDDEEFVNFAKNIGSQLKCLTEDQNVLAQKLISDVIFHARINNLNLDTGFTNLNSDGYGADLPLYVNSTQENVEDEEGMESDSLDNQLLSQVKTENVSEDSDEG